MASCSAPHGRSFLAVSLGEDGVVRGEGAAYDARVLAIPAANLLERLAMIPRFFNIFAHIILSRYTHIGIEIRIH